MTNSLAISLAASLIAAVGADQVWLDGDGALLTARKFAEMVEYMAFWR